jgi:AAA family ATPase
MVNNSSGFDLIAGVKIAREPSGIARPQGLARLPKTFLKKFQHGDENPAETPNHTMSISQDTKILEVKIRPWQNPKERTDQKGVARVHLSSHALQDLGLKPEQTCYLWKAEDGPEKRRQAVVWYSHENSMRKNVAQISKTFQDVCDFKLGDDLKISAAGNLAIAESVVLKDITPPEENNQAIPELDRPFWESHIAESLCR